MSQRSKGKRKGRKEMQNKLGNCPILSSMLGTFIFVFVFIFKSAPGDAFYTEKCKLFDKPGKIGIG